MTDRRLDSFTTTDYSANQESIKIKKMCLNNFKFFYQDFELNIDGENILLYGENGSGKSSIYKALELLTKNDFSDFDSNMNIFATDDSNEMLSAEFTFTDNSQISFDDSESEIPDDYEFLKGLSIFRPFFDYKRLLKVHYSNDNGRSKVNLYSMFRQLLKDYPVRVDDKDTTLGMIDDLEDYYFNLKDIFNELKPDINKFLKDYFDCQIQMISLEAKTIINTDDNSATSVSVGATPTVNIEIDYYDKPVKKYHVFLNEARLTALAMSIYFVAIKKLMGKLEETNVIKLLVLDDILISLDMSNRMKLLKILKEEFSSFQIFFFTHDKELFELYKNKLSLWKKYELYIDDSEPEPRAIIKTGTSDFERAKMFYAKKDYDCCAMLLRKDFERCLKKILSKYKRRIKKYLRDMIKDAIKVVVDNEIKNLLNHIDSNIKHILNPQCHSEPKNIHSLEMKQAIDDLELLKGFIV